MVDKDDSKALLLFTFGPVQSFITTARRTQDLWAGSRLLSHFAKVAIQAAETYGARLLYPVHTPAGMLPDSLPNKFVARISADSTIPKAVEKAMRDEWTALTDAVYTYFASLAPADGWQKKWDRQMDKWLETYWVLWTGELADYGSAYNRATLALDARKRVRAFEPIAEPGDKCTLCGEREALRGDKGRWQNAAVFWRELGKRPQVTAAQVRPEGRERLCALCATKRFLQDATTVLGKERFPSTSSIAAAPFKAKLLKAWTSPGVAVAVRDHLNVLSGLRKARLSQPEPIPFLQDLVTPHGGLAVELLYYDGDVFYPETFEEDQLAEALGRELSDADKAAGRLAAGTLDKLLNTAADLDMPPPDRYLAALALDGDRMGALLAQARSPADHERISRALAAFAQTTVPDIVERGDFAGKVVYAGGDDVLALLPTGQALGAADVVRQEFADAMDTAGYPNRHASAGIAIFHHSHPLGSGLRAAHAAQGVAKDEERYGRNAVVVHVLRRSGEARQAGLKWTYLNGPTQALEPILKVQAEMAADRLSAKFAYAVAEEAPTLMGVQDAWGPELGRLLKRQRGEKLTDAEKQAIADLAVPLVQLARAANAGRPTVPGWGLLELTEWLLLARFLAQGGRT